MKIASSIGFTFIVVLLFAATVSAQLLGPEHIGDNYPGSGVEGFQVNGGEPVGAPDNGFWAMTTKQNQRYFSDTGPITGDFTLTVRGSVSHNQDANFPGTLPVESRATGINFQVDAIENANPRYGFGWNEPLTRVIMVHNPSVTPVAQFFELDATQVHTYQLIRDSGVADFWVDGTKVIADVFADGFNVGAGLDDHAGLFLGSLSSAIPSESTSKWDIWRLEQGVHPIAGGNPITEFTWAAMGAGDWNEMDNWSSPFSGAPPNSNDETAIFGDSIGSNSRTVFTDSDITVKSIQFQNNLNGSYTVVGAGSINLAPNTASSAITVTQGSHEVQAIVNLLADTTVNTIQSGSLLTFTNTVNLNGHTLTKTGAGDIAINNVLNTAGGTVNLTQGSMSGNGSLEGNVNNTGGTISPGSLSDGNVGVVSVVPEPASAMLFWLGLSTIYMIWRNPRMARPLLSNP
ncbi:MAG: hypothetical protein MK179_21155 [Pirellulaceae bacterium]|nr:hypothetical protein [Pirellulaceae bacterium]